MDTDDQGLSCLWDLDPIDDEEIKTIETSFSDSVHKRKTNSKEAQIRVVTGRLPKWVDTKYYDDVKALKSTEDLGEPIDDEEIKAIETSFSVSVHKSKTNSKEVQIRVVTGRLPKWVDTKYYDDVKALESTEDLGEPIDDEEIKAIETSFSVSVHKRKTNCKEPQIRVATRRLPKWANTKNYDDVKTSKSTEDLCTPSRNNRKWNLVPFREMRYPAMNFVGRIIYARTYLEAEESAKDLLRTIAAKRKEIKHISLGFDIEWRPSFKKGETPRKSAVMQICMSNQHCYVIHIFHSGIPPSLQLLLEDPSSVKVGVCIANDALKILRDYGFHVNILEDLSSLANVKIGGVPRKWGLSSLAEYLICRQLEKSNKVRLSDWETDVLSREQLQYAATDAFASWYLYQVLSSLPDVDSENLNK